jgi:hypothetical protein
LGKRLVELYGPLLKSHQDEEKQNRLDIFGQNQQPQHVAQTRFVRLANERYVVAALRPCLDKCVRNITQPCAPAKKIHQAFHLNLPDRKSVALAEKRNNTTPVVPPVLQKPI